MADYTAILVRVRMFRNSETGKVVRYTLSRTSGQGDDYLGDIVVSERSRDYAVAQFNFVSDDVPADHYESGPVAMVLARAIELLEKAGA